MDKNAFSVANLGDNDAHDYWKDKTPQERLEALEQLRQIVFGYDPSTARIQRVLTVTELKGD
jgi:hypothetical protein